MSFLGLDLSLTSTGFSVVGPSVEMMVGLLQSKDLRGAERLEWIEAEIVKVLEEYRPVGVGLEGYSVGSKRRNSRAHDIGELGGVIRLLLWKAHIPVLLVPPASAKKFGTGNGGADKPAMVREVNRLYGLDLRPTQHDMADGVVLGMMAWARFGGRAPGSIAMLEALNGCEVLPAKPRPVRLRDRPCNRLQNSG